MRKNVANLSFDRGFEGAQLCRWDMAYDREGGVSKTLNVSRRDRSAFLLTAKFPDLFFVTRLRALRGVLRREETREKCREIQSGWGVAGDRTRNEMSNTKRTDGATDVLAVHTSRIPTD